MWTFILFSQLALIALIDQRTLRIPNGLNALLALSGLGFILATDPEAAPLHLAAAIVALLLAWGLQLAYERWRGRAGLGTGDVKLIGALTLWVGPTLLPTLLLIASLSGLVTALGLHLLSRIGGEGDGVTLATRLPFGPHLALGGAFTWALGPL